MLKDLLKLFNKGLSTNNIMENLVDTNFYHHLGISKANF